MEYKMKPIKMIDKWYIEVNTKEFGKVLLLKSDRELLEPILFSTEKEAQKYIKNYKRSEV